MPGDIFIPGSSDGWPPPVRLRVSRRAQHAQVRISPHEGLTVVLPHWFAPSRYLEILASKRDWIERHLDRRREMFPDLEPDWTGRPPAPPTVLEFRATGERVSVEYVGGRGRARLRENGRDRIVVAIGNSPGAGLGDIFGAGRVPGLGEGYCQTSGQTLGERPGHMSGQTSGQILGKTSGEAAAVAAVIRTLLAGYLKKAGARILPVMLENAASGTGLTCSSCAVGFASRRWGSCTAKGTIRLSAKLLFLPPRLARHVMLHELAHLRHLNHSQAFYRVLEEFDPHWRVHNRELAKAQVYLPALLW